MPNPIRDNWDYYPSEPYSLMNVFEIGISSLHDSQKNYSVL
jgi:hypothetical protein